jgi:hypothetical protein
MAELNSVHTVFENEVVAPYRAFVFVVERMLREDMNSVNLACAGAVYYGGVALHAFNARVVVVRVAYGDDVGGYAWHIEADVRMVRIGHYSCARAFFKQERGMP